MQVGQFVLDRKLGQGGMAEVWLSHHAVLGTSAAVKFLIAPWAGHPELEQRFLKEAQRQGALDHPNLVKVYGFDYVDGHSFLIMQYIDGETLDDRLARNGRKPLPTSDILRIATGALQGLEYAHGRGIVHRDIKPSNIMLDRALHAYIGDFGLVMVRTEQRMTRTGATMGTPLYMSPEQIVRPKEVDHRADIYSFGCVLFEMFTGHTPFESSEDDSEFSIKLAHTSRQPPSLRQVNPAVAPAVEAVVMRCLEKRPEDRFASCDELREALAGAISEGAAAGEAGDGAPAVVFPWDDPREIARFRASQPFGGVPAVPAAPSPSAPPPPPARPLDAAWDSSRRVPPGSVPPPPPPTHPPARKGFSAALAAVLSALALASLAGGGYYAYTHRPGLKKNEKGEQGRESKNRGANGDAAALERERAREKQATLERQRQEEADRQNRERQQRQQAQQQQDERQKREEEERRRQALSTAPLADARFSVRLNSAIGSDAGEEGTRFRATVLSPAAYRGGLMEGIVKRAGKGVLGFMPGRHRAALLISFYALDVPGGARPVESRVVSFSNSRGEPNTDEEGEQLDRKDSVKRDIITYAVGTAAGAVVSIPGRKKGSAGNAASKKALIAGIALTGLSAKGDTVSFAPGSVFELLVSDRPR